MNIEVFAERAKNESQLDPECCPSSMLRFVHFFLASVYIIITIIIIIMLDGNYDNFVMGNVAILS